MATFNLTQTEIAKHLDLSERAVREFLDAAGIDHRLATLAEIRVAYIRRLREQAAGRATNGDLTLATERAGLARAQRVRIEMENAREQRLLVRVEEIEPRMKAAAVHARALWLEAAPRLARELPGDPIQREEMLQAEFEAFLHRLADWAHAGHGEDEIDA